MRPVEFMGKKIQVPSETGSYHRGVVTKVSCLSNGMMRFVLDTEKKFHSGSVVPLREGRFAKLKPTEASFTVNPSDVTFLD